MRCRFRRSTTHKPRVHWPVVSMRMSSGDVAEGFHPPSSAVIAYQTHTGSCRLRSAASPTCPGCSLSSVRKVWAIKAATHSAKGDPPSRSGVMICRNWPCVTPCLSVISRGNVRRVSCLLRLGGYSGRLVAGGRVLLGEGDVRA